MEAACPGMLDFRALLPEEVQALVRFGYTWKSAKVHLAHLHWF